MRRRTSPSAAHTKSLPRGRRAMAEVSPSLDTILGRWCGVAWIGVVWRHCGVVWRGVAWCDVVWLWPSAWARFELFTIFLKILPNLHL